MKKGAAQTVYLVGTSTKTRGGIGYVIGAYLNSELSTQFRLIHIVTHQDGNALRKGWTYATALARFFVLRFVRGAGLVHIHSSSGPSFLRKAVLFFLSKCLGCRVIFHIHSGGFLDYYHSRSKMMRGFIRYVLKTSDHVVVLTASWKKKLEELIQDGTRISVVGNPIDTSKYHPFAKPSTVEQQPHLLYLGALIKNKGVYDIVDCMRRLKDMGVDCRATLAGDRELDKVRARSKEAGVEERIELPGWVGEATKIELLKSADLLVLPSYHEGLPLCVLEAMAFGLPVVCSNAGGLKDIVKHGENGFVITPGDIDGMANAIATFVTSPALREQMGRRNADTVQNTYSIPAVAQQVSKLYSETLNKTKRSLFFAGGHLRHLPQEGA